MITDRPERVSPFGGASRGRAGTNVGRASTDSEPAGEWPSDWLRATLGFLALRALEEGPSYGYAIIAELERHGLGTIKGGTLYPLLTRFETAGMVATEWRPGEAGPGRKYFALTEFGRTELERLRADWARFTEISNGFLSTARPSKEIIE